MARVINGLIHREAQTRYGRLQIGYLWAFIEPMIFISIFELLFQARGRHVSILPTSVPLVLFLTTSFLPFFLFRDVFTRTMTAIRPNAQLLYFPQVHVFELCIGRALVEIINSIIVFSIFMLLIDFTGLAEIHIERPLELMECAMLLILLGFGGGMIAGSLLLLFPSIEFLTSAFILRPLLILSGVIFTIDRVPQEFREIMLYNPVLHLIEMFRSAFFHEYESIYVDKFYVYGWVLTLLFLGLTSQRAFRKFALRKGL